MLKVPHPRTRVFYGKHQKSKILQHFKLPLIAKVPRGSAMGRGVFLIRSRTHLADYCRREPTAYIQEYLPMDRDMRIIVIGRQVVHAYWRIAASGEFRTNIGLGGQISLAKVPDEALNLALSTAKSCQWNDVGLDICQSNGKYYVLEANMKYGREGFRRAGIDYYELMERLIDDDLL
jgi:ribosomal protein S6--L-glutamate ligase